MTNLDVVRIRAAEANIPIKHRVRRLDVVEEHPAASRLVTDFRDFYVTDSRPLDEYPEDRSTIGQGLALVGPPGTGKTTLSCAILMEMLHRRPLVVRFMEVADFFDVRLEQRRLERILNVDKGAEARWFEIENFVADAASASLLVMDDLGKERSTETKWTQDEVIRLVRKRHREGKPTIITTNLAQRDVSQRYGDAFADFWREAFVTITMAKESHRK